MNSKFFSQLIVAMCIALTGTIFLQLYWIGNAVELRNEEFNGQVNAALQGVVDRLEVEEYYRSDTKTPADSSNSLDRMRTKYLASVKNCFGFQPASDILCNKPIDRKVFVKVRNRAYANAPVEENKPQMITVGNEDDFSRIVKQASNMGNGFKTLEVITELNTSPLNERIALGELQNLIYTYLVNQGIDIPFEYALFSPQKRDSLVAFSAGYKSLDNTSIHQVKLFPNDILPRNHYLVVTFADRTNYILESLEMMLLLSLLFTGTIVAVFIYTIGIIRKQKKIAEIRNDFINNMTHEFKTPLATISLAIDAVNDPKVMSDESRIRHYSGIIKEENSRMNSQVEKVLQVALTERSDMEFVKGRFDMHETIQASLEQFDLQLRQKNAKVTTRLDATNSTVFGDEFHLGHAIHNIIDNAIKYSGSVTDITISTWNEAEELHISISDKGIGMTKDIQKQVFDKFYRAHTGNIHEVKGFGLGLSYAKNIIEKHNGSIKVASEPGNGSTFTIILNQQDTQE